MPLKPVGHRILVTPDVPEEQTTSGIVLPGDRDHVPVSGIVAAVGDGPARDARIRAKTIARCLSILDELDELWAAYPPQYAGEVRNELERYKNQVEQFDGTLQVGDRVVYPAESGLKVSENGQDYILLNEDDVVVIATEEAAA